MVFSTNFSYFGKINMLKISMKPIFLIVDDHPIIVEVYCSVLEQRFSSGEFYKATTINAAIEYANTLPYVDFLIVDYQIGREQIGLVKDGVDLARIFRKTFPFIKILVITASEVSLVIYKIHKNVFPDGLMIKSDVRSELLIQAILEIKKGKQYYSTKAKQSLKSIAQYNLLQQDHNIEILLLLAKGYQINEISKLMLVSEGMLHKRIARLKEVFNVDDRGGLLRAAQVKGFL